jgi:mannose-6-phosphate isomerase-like protein (cupin superfamily)
MGRARQGRGGHHQEALGIGDGLVALELVRRHETVDRGARFQVKRIIVNPGQRISLQTHAKRAEHWVCVQGVARVTRGEDILTLRENMSTYIPVGCVHRLENVGSEPVHIIEVQSGGYLGEADIQRIEDSYGRA